MDITTYALLKKKIDSLGISDAKILEVVETFLLAHPEYIGATDEQVAQIVANAAAIQELQAEAVTIVTLDEYNAFTEEQKKEKVYLIWDKDTDNVKADLDVITLDEYNALSETEKKKRDYLIYSEEKVLIDEVLDENSTRPVQNKVITKEINEIKKSVSDGKEMLAVAITEKGIETASNDSFSTMAANIEQIESGGGIDKNLRTVKFLDNEKIIAQYAGLPGDHIMSPLDVNSKSYGGWQDVNGVFIKFPLKISEDINVYKSSKLYDLNGSSIWENGWTYSSEPTRKITDEYIEFIKNYTSSSDEKNAIQTVNKYELTNARMLRFVLNVSDTTDNTYTSDKPIFWAILLPSKNQQWGLNDYSFRLTGTEIVDGTYDVDLSSVSGEYYISFACQHKDSKADIKISNIEIYE